MPTRTPAAQAVVPQFVTTDVALGNTALQVALYDTTHTAVDVADDGVGNPLAGAFDSSKKMYASMERNPVPGDGRLTSSWHTASQGVGFKTGAVERGTPGSANSNGLPTAEAGPNQNGSVGSSINFDGSDSSDPEGQTLAGRWDFGDGTTSEGLTPTHIYSDSGTYHVQLIVSDGTDLAADTLTVEITAAPPIPSPTTTVSPETKTTTSTNASCRGMQLSEVVPNPTGVDTDEFIELVNTGDEEVSVSGCSVWTTATRSYTIEAADTITRGQFYILKKSLTKLTLNNGGATVRLVDVDGAELDRTTYSNAPEGQAWISVNGSWQWTAQPTAGSTNRLVQPKVTSKPKATSTTTVKKIAPPVSDVTLQAIQDLDSGDRVKVAGVVISPRDVLGATLIALQSDDGGVMVSIPNGAPTLALGQNVTVIGTVRLKQGRRYIAADGGSIQLGTVSSTVEPAQLATDDIGVEQADRLVHVKGVVGLASGNSIEVDDGSGPLSVYIKSSTGIVRPKLKAGDTVDAVGIVSVTTSGVRVLPRLSEDIHVERVLGAATTASTPTYVAPAASARQTLWYWLLVFLGAMAISAKPAWQWWQKKKTTNGS